jgi:hypothetical protein
MSHERGCLHRAALHLGLNAHRSRCGIRTGASVSCDLTAVYVQCLTGDESGLLEIEDPLDDVADFVDSANWVKAGHALVWRGWERRRTVLIADVYEEVSRPGAMACGWPTSTV